MPIPRPNPPSIMRSSCALKVSDLYAGIVEHVPLAKINSQVTRIRVMDTKNLKIMIDTEHQFGYSVYFMTTIIFIEVDNPKDFKNPFTEHVKRYELVPDVGYVVANVKTSENYIDDRIKSLKAPFVYKRK